MSAREVPPGCIEIPGIILEIRGGKAWITQAGQITTDWRQRGIWPTAVEAIAVLDQVFGYDGETEDGP